MADNNRPLDPSKPPEPINDEERTELIDSDGDAASVFDGKTISGPEVAPSSESPGRTPSRIGGYTIIDKLGEGSMGLVYEAEQERPKMRVALEIMRSIDTHTVDELHAKVF